jgi:hypothetical protein
MSEYSQSNESKPYLAAEPVNIRYMTFPTISMEARENNQKMKLNSAARDALYRVGSKV